MARSDMGAKSVEAARDLHQVTLDELLAEASEGDYVHVPLAKEDIGGQLLALISRGLYTNPLHALREYVQNAVDAHATEIKIRVTANAITITDNGDGMNGDDVVKARRFGVSDKDLQYNVGFRGVGIYSGYDLCNRLVITSKKSGVPHRYILVFNFGDMRREQEARRKDGRPTLPLQELIEMYSSFTWELEEKARHFTIVELEDVTPAHLPMLSDHVQMRQYILRNLPVDFDEMFPHRAVINSRLADEVPDFRAVRIILDVAGAPREIVAKPAIPHLARPTMGPVYNSRGDKIAYFWACLRQPPYPETRGQIPDQFADFRGFVYKLKGFTIGDNRKLKGAFRRGKGTLFDWYMGEVYVIDPAVTPNAERDDFEASNAKTVLEAQVEEALRKLDVQAEEYRTESKAYDTFYKRDRELRDLASQVDGGEYHQFDVYHQLNVIIDDLSGQQSKLSKELESWGSEVMTRATDLKRLVSGDMSDPQPAPKRRREGAKRRERASFTPPPAPPGSVSEPENSSGPANASAESSTGEQEDPGDADPAQEKPLALALAIENEGWVMDDDSSFLIDIVDRTLIDIFGSGSAEYRQIVNEVGLKLAQELQEPRN